MESQKVSVAYQRGSSAERGVREALSCVAETMPAALSLKTIARILKGEVRSDWLSYIARTESWGTFLPTPLEQVETFLKELVRIGFLKEKRGLHLTEEGQRFLSQDAISLPPLPTVRLVERRHRRLLWKLLLLRGQLSAGRRRSELLADDLILRILKKRPITLEDLAALPGVTPKLVEKAGYQIIALVREVKRSL
ncbi:MAG: HRDC domain-containing protein [Armatimonadetes bacterium]|nr:HRDC domain-containing protein [Armatimonadota bacterium]MDW8121444.1 HRDC domain-containing protein [Armatimonadota bacterium]